MIQRSHSITIRKQFTVIKSCLSKCRFDTSIDLAHNQNKVYYNNKRKQHSHSKPGSKYFDTSDNSNFFEILRSMEWVVKSKVLLLCVIVFFLSICKAIPANENMTMYILKEEWNLPFNGDPCSNNNSIVKLITFSHFIFSTQKKNQLGEE